MWVYLSLVPYMNTAAHVRVGPFLNKNFDFFNIITRISVKFMLIKNKTECNDGTYLL